MLKKRIITALILIPLFLFLIFKLPPSWFACVTSAIIFVAAWEWSYLLGVKRLANTFIYPVIVLLVLYNCLWGIPIAYILWTALIWWIIALFLVVTFPKTQRLWSKSIWIKGMMGLLVLVPCWVALNLIRYSPNGSYSLLFLFLLIWGADSGAYFAGKRFGKRPLARAISPGKTIEGVVGGLLLCIAFAFGILWWLNLPYINKSYALILCLLTVLFSILGDLFESMLKRNANIKDSSALLPGHGGILDRIDSLTAAAPIFVLGSMWLTQV